MEVTEDQVVEIIRAVWADTLNLDLDRVQNGVPSSQFAMSAVVQVTGSWQGATTVHCSERLAGAIAAAMFGSEPGTSTEDEMRDALGEVVNMIAGNMKVLLPPGCQISLPTVVEGSDYHLVIPGSSKVLDIPFISVGQPLSVRVLSRR